MKQQIKTKLRETLLNEKMVLNESDDMKFTSDDIDACWPIYAKNYLVDILNGDYDLVNAREDLRSLIGSKWDPRKS